MGLKDQTQAIADLFTHELSGPIGSAAQALEMMEKRIEGILSSPELQAWRAGLKADLTAFPHPGHLSEKALKIFKLGYSMKCVKLGMDSSIGILKNLRHWDSSDKLEERFSVTHTFKVAWVILSSRHKHLAVRWNLEKLPAIKGNPHALTQVWMNILSNAAQVNKRGCEASVSAQRSDRKIIILIANNGLPLPPGLDLFKKGVSKRVGGTGLGLYLSRRIIKTHGGTITAENAHGYPVFTIELPVC